jgi:hypothetical protein
VIEGIKATTKTMFVLAWVILLGACEETERLVPTESQVLERFSATDGVTIQMSGNVAEVTVLQPYSQVRRGGTLWAKVGPYIYLFSDEVHTLLTDFSGLAGVRVITTTRTRGEIARAFILRSDLSDVLWRRSKNIAGRARRDGTKRPSLLEALVQWGEDHAEHTYSPRFVR